MVNKKILRGRLTESQTKQIEEIFWENNYSAMSYVIRDLVKIGLKHQDEFDKIKMDSPIEEEVRYLLSDSNIANIIKEIRKEKKIKDYIAVVRTLIEIGLKHRDELPNSSA